MLLERLGIIPARLTPDMPNPSWRFDRWMRALVEHRYEMGYGGCDAPVAPVDQTLPARGEDFDANELAARLLHTPTPLLPHDDPLLGGRHDSYVSADLGGGTILQDIPEASAIMFRFMRLMGRYGETVYAHTWHWKGTPVYPFPRELQRAIDAGRRTILFRATLGGLTKYDLKLLSFFEELHALLAAHP